MGGSLKVLLLGVSKTGGCDLWCQKNRQRMCVCVFFEVCLHFRKCKEGMICMMFGDLPENIVHFLGYGIPCLTQDRQHMLFWCILCFDCPFLWISPPPPKKKRVVVELGKMTWTCLVLWFWSFGSAFQFVGFFWGSQSKGVPTKHDNFCGYVQPFWCFFFFIFLGWQARTALASRNAIERSPAQWNQLQHDYQFVGESQPVATSNAFVREYAGTRNSSEYYQLQYYYQFFGKGWAMARCFALVQTHARIQHRSWRHQLQQQYLVLSTRPVAKCSAFVRGHATENLILL